MVEGKELFENENLVIKKQSFVSNLNFAPQPLPTL